jgi:DNA-binding Lrp family transcriptional regulator
VRALTWGMAVVQAYVLVQTKVGDAGQVARELERIPGVVSSDPVTGPYDVVVRVEASDLDDLGRVVAVDVQGIDGITRTLTCVIPQSEIE